MTFIKIHDHLYKVATDKHDHPIGALLRDVDGFFYFFPVDRGGSWPANIMRTIADKLDELNKPWKEQIARDLGPVQLLDKTKAD